MLVIMCRTSSLKLFLDTGLLVYDGAHSKAVELMQTVNTLNFSIVIWTERLNAGGQTDI